MPPIRLPGARGDTSRLGFGCASLTGGTSRGRNLRLLHAAFEAGFRHFDVAPPYGFGTAENVLGDAFADRRGRVTIVSKVGIARPRRPALLVAARAVAAPLRRLAPGLTKKAGSRAYTASTSRGQFGPDFVEASLAETLRRLRTDRLDAYLLHEVSLEDVTDELLTFLDKRKRDGVLGAVGTATSPDATRALQRSHPEVFDVWQHDSWAEELGTSIRRAFTITHRPLSGKLDRVRDWLGGPGRLAHASAATGRDLARPGELATVLLGLAVSLNRDGIVLVASREPARMREHASLLSDDGPVEAGRVLGTLLAADGLLPPGTSRPTVA